MIPSDDKLWAITKVLSYVGAILVTVCVAMIGIFHKEPPDVLFYTGIGLVAAAVVIGNFVALRKSRKH
jgi:NADH:ubiquinone oxidoreductase subunit 6 (subunit J)